METTTDVVGYDASLQPFVKKGKACARLYIQRSFTDWKKRFNNSWVGFYNRMYDEHSRYEKWQWVTKLKENPKKHTETTLAYEYVSGLGFNHDVQARFFLQKDHSDVRATTRPWGISKPTDVVGYGASLQPFAKKGKACARLYIQRSFTDWKKTFYYSWVGFYNLTDDGHSRYKHYQWVANLKENPNLHTERTLAFEYESGLDIQGGVQVRFFLKKAYSSVLAHTVPWGKKAIREIQNNVRGYDASLQLMRCGGKVCARLYIKRTFTDWKDKFYYSWVGFYKSSSARSVSYDIWNGMTSFKRNEDKDTEEYMAYEYCCDMAVRPGIEARFFLSKDYSQERCRIGL